MRNFDYQWNGKQMDAWSEFLGRYYWQFWITGVFGKHLMNMKAYNAIKFVEKSFIEKLRRPGVTVSWFGVIEYYRSGGVHVHIILTILPGNYSYPELGLLWRNGNGIRSETGRTIIEPAGYFQVEAFDHSRGVGGYLSKYISKDLRGEMRLDLKESHLWCNVLKYISDKDNGMDDKRRGQIGNEHIKLSDKRRAAQDPLKRGF